MAFAFDDHAAALAVLQLHKTLGENDAVWGNTASALHACCHGHPGWLIINGAGATVTTLQKPMTIKIRCASGIAGEYRGGTNWGQPMLVQDRLVLMWPTDIYHTSERASEQLIVIASTISVSASDASEIALIPGRAHLLRVGMDSEATLPHALDATTLMDNEMSSGGSEGWWKSGAVAEPWGETTTAGSYTVQERAVDTPCKRALGAMVEAEGAFGKSFVCRGFWQSVFLRQWLPATALLPLVDCYVVRQELVRYHSGYDLERVPNSESPTIVRSLMAMVEAEGNFGKVLDNSDARRQRASMLATLSPDNLSVVRQELSRYDSGCDFQRLPNSEPCKRALGAMVEAGGAFGKVLEGMAGEESTTWHGAVWTGVELVRELTLTFGRMGVEKRMWDCAPHAESEWEWDCRAGMQEVWVPGHTAAQAVSLPDGAPISHSHETHLYAAASLREALNVGGSVLQTQPGSSSSGRMRGVVAAMRLRGGGWQGIEGEQLERTKEGQGRGTGEVRMKRRAATVGAGVANREAAIGVASREAAIGAADAGKLVARCKGGSRKEAAE